MAWNNWLATASSSKCSDRTKGHRQVSLYLSEIFRGSFPLLFRKGYPGRERCLSYHRTFPSLSWDRLTESSWICCTCDLQSCFHYRSFWCSTPQKRLGRSKRKLLFLVFARRISCREADLAFLSSFQRILRGLFTNASRREAKSVSSFLPFLPTGPRIWCRVWLSFLWVK